MLINVNEIAEAFLGQAVRECRKDRDGDDKMIGALNDPTLCLEFRKDRVIEWLRSFATLRGLNSAEHDGVAEEIVKFADARPRTDIRLSREEILGRFGDLHMKCSGRVHKNRDETPRNLTSLSSKALWCCYPHSIPVFDSRARRALCAISRLLLLDRARFAPPRRTGYRDYEPFLTAWFDLYDRVEPTIANERLLGYPYKVRVFDRILWIIGELDYGLKKASGAAS